MLEPHEAPGPQGHAVPPHVAPPRPLPEASCGEAALLCGPSPGGSSSPGERSWPGLRGVAHAGPFGEGNVSLPQDARSHVLQELHS